MSFKDFKKHSKGVGIDDVTKELESVSGKGEKDERFWYPKMDEKRNSFSIIRFLPPKFPEKQPAVRTISYYIEGPGGLYRENSPAAINLADPVKEYSKQLWASGDEEEARKLFPKTYYISNVLILKDPGNPDNEGKVFLFKYGKKIFTKIQEKVKPSFAAEERINVFDLWEGANFKLKTCEQGGFVNYDKSEFDAKSSLYDGDEELLEQVYNSLYELQPFVAEDNFKPYEELKATFYKVMGLDLEEGATPAKQSTPSAKPKANASGGKQAAPAKQEEEDDIPNWDAKPSSGKAATTSAAPASDDTEDEDETLAGSDDDEDGNEETEVEEKFVAPKPKPNAASATAKPQAATAIAKPKPNANTAKAATAAPAKAKTPPPAKDEAVSGGDYSFFEDN